MAREIVVDIAPDGKVTIEGKGFTGTECTKVTADLEAALGEVEAREFKPEYRQAPAKPRRVAR